MAKEDLESIIKKTKWLLPLTIIIGIILLASGIGFMSTAELVITKEFKFDYTNCKSVETNEPCPQYMSYTDSNCPCFQDIVLKEDVLGTVTAYYELLTYDQSVYASSKDDNQLSGNITGPPSKACGEFRFDVSEGNRTIVPCGALADSMFNDTFDLRFVGKSLPILIGVSIPDEDRKGFLNPPGDLEQALRNFSKPKSWRKSLWEFDADEDNNGFENEMFIGWMRTDWKKKPLWQIQNKRRYKNGIPKGKYDLRIDYNYPLSRYNGTRLFILSASLHHSAVGKYVFGSVSLILGILVLIAAGFLHYILRTQRHSADPTLEPVVLRRSEQDY